MPTPLFKRARPTTAACLLLSAGLLMSACGSASGPSAGSTPGAGQATLAPSSAGGTVPAVAVSAASASSPAGAPLTGSAAGGVSTVPNLTAPNSPVPNSTVTISITDAKGCVASPDTVPAGAVTFDVKNLDATGITELELVAEQRIVGERENLTPGFDATFSVKLNGGSYQIYCPGGAVERRPFTVTGQAAASGAGDIDVLLQQAAVDYAAYVDDQIEFLIPPVQQLVTAIKAGNVAAAQAAYARARPFYERIEPVAESFPELDSVIDLRVGDVEAGAAWTGFHPVEKGLFAAKSTKGLEPLATGLLADIKKLQVRAKKLSVDTVAKNGKGYQASEIANGASGLLDEVLKSKITGEEEAYSRIDLLDFHSNVEGSLQAYATLEPALEEIDPTLGPVIAAKFGALNKVLEDYRSEKSVGGWVSYPDLTAADKKKLTDALLAVQEPLSAVSAKITR